MGCKPLDMGGDFRGDQHNREAGETMREIIFRGKRIDNGEWVCGCLTIYSNRTSYITVDLIENEIHEVHPETVGQFTGLLDKNGKRIFEGDRLSTLIKRGELVGRFTLKDPGQYLEGVVTWNLEQCRYELIFDENEFDIVSQEFGWMREDIEIIGNIHDKP